MLDMEVFFAVGVSKELGELATLKMSYISQAEDRLVHT
jgi:hypothetical protein